MRTDRAVFANLPRGDDSGARLSVRYRGPVEAPIAEGERIAVLRIDIPGQEPHDVPLVAAADMPRANAWQRLRNGLVGLF